MSSLTVREGRAEDSAQLQSLFAKVFGYDRGERHYRWKLNANPAGAPVVVVAEDAGRIVGQHALWPNRFRAGSETVSGAQSIDAMVHPDYRGQGMFTRLGKEAMGAAADRGIEVLVAFPVAASLPGFIRSLGWQHVGDLTRSVRPLRPSQHPRVPPWAGRAADGVARLLPRGAPSGIQTRADKPTAAALTALVAAGDRNVSGWRWEKDAAYLSWRFAEGAGRCYHWSCAYRNEALTAVAVWGIDAQHGHAFLAELVGTDEASVRAVLALAIDQAWAAERPAIFAVGLRDGLHPILRRASFVPRGNLPVMVRQLSTRPLPVDVHNSAAWTIFGADLDTM